jgi:hypothetical protein
MNKFGTIVRYVLGSLLLLVAVADVLDAILFNGWTLQLLAGVCFVLWLAYVCFRPLLSKIESVTLLRYVVGGYFTLGAVARMSWAAIHVERRWYNVDIACVQFLIALACLWPLLSALYNKQKAEGV